MLISCRDLSVGFGRHCVASGISFSVPERSSLLVLGHNGAGKSTLIRTLMGLLPPLRGQGDVLGLELSAASPKSLIARGVRYLGQGHRSFDDLQVRDHRSVLTRLYGYAAVSNVESPAVARQRVGELSVGWRRLEGLWLLAAGSPRVFMLDEPLSGLDAANCQNLISWMQSSREDGTSFVVVEHDFRHLLTILDQALVLRRGEVTFYGPARDLCNEALLADVYL